MKLFRELARLGSRQICRLRLIVERRTLARRESALGLLGWQQADYAGPIRDEVKRLTDYEREQSRLGNESAQLALEIRKLGEQRNFEAREFAVAQAAVLKQAQSAAVDPDALEALVAAKRKESREIEARLPVIDRELREAEAQYRGLVRPGLPSPEVRAQLLSFHKLITALPREREEWMAKIRDVAEEAAAMEALLDRLRATRARFEERDHEIEEEIATRERARRKVEKQVETLEKAKLHPYREIGRALADHHVAPLNQPEALTHVLEQRQKIAEIEAMIAASLEESAREGGLPKLWLLAGGLIGHQAMAFLAIDGQ